MTLTLLCLFLTNSCVPERQIIIVGEATTVGKLENGNWEVTPLFFVEYRMLKDEVERLTKEIEILKARIKKLGDKE